MLLVAPVVFKKEQDVIGQFVGSELLKKSSQVVKPDEGVIA
jgi:hypothetical protein